MRSGSGRSSGWLCVAGVLLLAGPVRAATSTWPETTTAGDWSSGPNWAGGIAPVSAVDTIIVFSKPSSGTVTSNDDLAAGFLLNRLEIGGSNGSTLTLGGNSLAFRLDGATAPTLVKGVNGNDAIDNDLVLDADLTLQGDGANRLSLNGVISGTGSLTKTGSCYVQITHDTNTYSGGTTITAGTLELTVWSEPGTGPLVLDGGTLRLNRVDLSNTLVLNGGSLFSGNGFGNDLRGPITLNADIPWDVYWDLRVHGVIDGPGGFIKTDPRRLLITGANTYTGQTVAQEGTLEVSSFNRVVGGTPDSNLGAPVTVADGTLALGNGSMSVVLRYTGPGETTDRVIALAGTTGGVTIDQAGTPAGLPTSRGESGLLKFTGDLAIPGTAGADNRKTLTLGHATKSSPGRGEIRGIIGDSVLGNAGERATSVTKTGMGTWILSGANTYTGTTRVENGRLVIARADALGGGPLDMTTGAVLQLDYVGTRPVASLSFDGGTAQPDGTYGSSESGATFRDDTRFAGIGTVTVGADAAPTTTALALTGGTNPSDGGASVTFTATVTGASPTGTLTFYDGLTVIGTGTLDGSFQATLTTSALAGGTHAITALYEGDAGNDGSASAALSHTVTEGRPATTTAIALTSGANPSLFGGALTLTATVTGASPAGLVNFYDGTRLMGSSALDGSFQASIATSTVRAGWRMVTARYTGDAGNAPSVSDPHYQQVRAFAGNGKAKVFILAGQSNMVAYGSVETGRDPDNPAVTNLVGGLGSLREMLNSDPVRYGYLDDDSVSTGTTVPGWRAMPNVRVTYWDETATELRNDLLDADFGAATLQGRLGPEYGFGLMVGSQLDDQVILIKYAQGGRSLYVDFRPPSSGGTTGFNYTDMVARVHQVLDNLGTYCPEYTGGGYEIAGFGWHQGWNDRVSDPAVAEYEVNLTNLINDLRSEFSAPGMRVVVATTGMADANASARAVALIDAQMNVSDPALHPEFAGTVASVDTRPFDFGTALSPSSQGYHWNHNGKSHFNIGERMGKAMMRLLDDPPAVLSVTRADASPTNATAVDFDVVFSEPVTGVAASHFVPVATGSVTCDALVSVSGGGASYVVTVGGIAGAGTLGLEVVVAGGGIRDASGTNTLAGDYTLGETYVIEPEVSLAFPQAGYHLIALPVDPPTAFTAESLAVDMNAGGLGVTRVLRYNGTGYDVHTVGSGTGFNIVVGEGYFIRCTNPGTWTVQGAPLNAGTAQLVLVGGYGLVGLPRVPASPYTAEAAILEINGQGGSATRMLRYNGTGYDVHTAGSGSGFTLLRGEGYFIRCTAGSTWDLDRP